MNKAILTSFFVALIVCLSFQTLVPTKEQRKQLQGPPSEFKDFAIPDPVSVAQSSDSALIPVYLTQNGNVYEWNSVLNVDSTEELSAAIFSPHLANLKIFLQPPGESDYTLLVDEMFTGEGTLGVKSSGPFSLDGAVADSTTYTFFEPIPGQWNVKIVSDTPLPIIKSQAYAYRFASSSQTTQPQAYVLISNKSPYKLESHLNSYVLEQGQQVGVVVQISNNPNFPDEDAQITPFSLAAESNVVVKAVLDIVTPTGEELIVPMHDDGLHADALANDGIYGATIQAAQSGEYLARAEITGRIPSTGALFYRTTQHLLSVAPIEAVLNNKAVASVDTTTKMATFSIGVTVSENKEVRAYAEVYGTNNNNKQQVPVGWASSVTPIIKNGDNDYIVQLDLHTSWMTVAGAKAPFTLKNVVLQDKDSFVILSSAAEISVQSVSADLSALLANSSDSPVAVFEVSDEMRYGPRPKNLRNLNKNNNSSLSSSAGNSKLLLVHGYCSGPVWDVNDFTNAIVFEDYQQSRSNDEFARMIMQFGADYSSYAIIAHSQGGLASLHLKTYYWSGLDALANGGRAIQTVGSPYRGCSLAGMLADLGWLFGLGCGSNFDLSRDGASLWYSKLPKNAGGPQSAVTTYLTRYVNNWWFFSNCVTASNLVLSKPNDGTCELNYAKLDAGNAQSTVSGWCHAAGMKYPPQTSDPARNKEMNTLAAR